MIIDRIVTKLINCSWSRKNYNEPAHYVEIEVYDTKDGEVVEFELYKGVKNPKPIAHITIGKKQLRTVLQLNEVIKQTPAESAAKSPMLPDAKSKPTTGGIACGLNIIR
jgi:hypothetical protein